MGLLGELAGEPVVRGILQAGASVFSLEGEVTAVTCLCMAIIQK